MEPFLHARPCRTHSTVPTSCLAKQRHFNATLCAVSGQSSRLCGSYSTVPSCCLATQRHLAAIFCAVHPVSLLKMPKNQYPSALCMPPAMTCVSHHEWMQAPLQRCNARAQAGAPKTASAVLCIAPDLEQGSAPLLSSGAERCAEHANFRCTLV